MKTNESRHPRLTLNVGDVVVVGPDGRDGTWTVVGYAAKGPDYKLVKGYVNGSIASQMFIDGDFDALENYARVELLERAQRMPEVA